MRTPSMAYELSVNAEFVVDGSKPIKADTVITDFRAMTVKVDGTYIDSGLRTVRTLEFYKDIILIEPDGTMYLNNYAEVMAALVS